MFYIDEDTTITVNINMPETLDLDIFLFKEVSGEPQLQDVIGTGGIGENESCSFSLTPGTYFLVVYEYNNHWSDNSYSIALNTQYDSCDINQNATIYLNDITILAEKYGTTSTSPDFVASYDLHQDGIIDIFDLMVIAKKIPS